jgi:uncharacterized protein (TIGR03437 family)
MIMRACKVSLGLLFAAAGCLAQVQTPAEQTLPSIFSGGLAVSLLDNDTVPASIISAQSATEFGGGFNFFASGSWIEIKGTGLATTTRTWAESDFTGGGLTAPTSLDGVSVTVNNQRAAMFFVSPTQVNVQVPGDSFVGPVEVRITNPSGGTATLSAQKRANAPGMLAPASFNAGGRQYLVAVFPDRFFVGRPNLIPGAEFRPARPGDNITAFGIGFGDVTPAVAPGVVVTQQNTTTLPVTLSFGQVPANITYRGLAPNFVGLYQFNFVVPDVPDGDHQINMTLGGQPLTQPAFYLTVQR